MGRKACQVCGRLVRSRTTKQGLPWHRSGTAIPRRKWCPASPGYVPKGGFSA